MNGVTRSARQARDGAILAPAPPAQERCIKCSRWECRCKGSRKRNRPGLTWERDKVTSTATYSQTPNCRLHARPETELADRLKLLMPRLVALLEPPQAAPQTIPNDYTSNYAYPTSASLQNMPVTADFSFFGLDTVGQQAASQPGSEISQPPSQLSQGTSGWISENQYRSSWDYSSVDTSNNGYVFQSGGDNYDANNPEKPDMALFAYQPDINSVATQQPLDALETMNGLHEPAQSYDGGRSDYENIWLEKDTASAFAQFDGSETSEIAPNGNI